MSDETAKAIAAELRRLADRMEAAGERFDKICRYEVVDGILRHRAKELDPDYGPCRSCGRTGEGIVCDQCEDDERQSP